MKNTSRFSIHEFDYRPYATMNHAVLSVSEIVNIESWCLEHNCKYYGIGLIEFPDRKTVTLFMLRWS